MIFTLSLFYTYIVCKKIFFIVALPQVIYNVYPYNMVKFIFYCIIFMMIFWAVFEYLIYQKLYVHLPEFLL